MFILAITTDDKLVNQLKSAGQIMKCTSADMAQEMIKSGEFDVIVLGDPYTEINPKTLRHDNVVVIKSKDDLTQFLKGKKKPNIFDEFANGVQEDTVKPVRKLRGPEPEAVEVMPKELGRILLATTNLELIKYLSDFNLRIVASSFSAVRALAEKPKLVIWDMGDEPFEPHNVLLYIWGKDILHKEDVIHILTNADLKI